MQLPLTLRVRIPLRRLQFYVIKFVVDLRQVGCFSPGYNGFLHHDITETIVENGVRPHNPIKPPIFHYICTFAKCLLIISIFSSILFTNGLLVNSCDVLHTLSPSNFNLIKFRCCFKLGFF